MRIQTHVEYLILVGIGAVLTLIAASAIIHVVGIISTELNLVGNLKNSIVEALT